MPEPASVRALVCRYIAEETPRKARSTQRHDLLYATAIIHAWGDLPIEQVTPRLVAALHRDLTVHRGPILANRIVSLVSQICDLAERDGLRDPGNPTRAVRKNSEPRRTKFLRAEMRVRFIDAANASLAAGEITRSAWTLALLMLLAGLRWSDVRWLRWEEVDLVQGCLRLLPRGDVRPENKGTHQRTIPLGDDALELLRLAPRFSSWVAPNRRTRAPYTNIRKPLAHICQRANVQITPHGLRHSFGTAAAEDGCSTPQIAALLGQRSPSSAERYVHLAGTSVRAVAQRVGLRVSGRAA